ncbi:ABC transporter permease subunit [Candidatus Sumerlaeota bacterium]|nr:ABC transporter permease subunit [Candidatus Sumerlaeota bacterium]
MKADFVPILKREIYGMAASPGFYVIAGLFFLLASGLFLNNIYSFVEDMFQQSQDPAYFQEPVNFTRDVVTPTFLGLAGLYLFFMPILLMRSLAEERASGTLELLTTSPVSDWGIVLGKFLGAVAANLLLLTGAGVYAALMLWIGDVEWPVLICCMAGLLLVGMAFASFGLFASALTRSQTAAAMIGFLGLLTLMLLRQFTPAQSGWIGKTVYDIAFQTHMEPLFKGVLRLEDMVYLALFTLFFLVLTHAMLKSRHWRA